jgi:hypothetical protein
MKEQLDHLLNKINRVTAYHRHGQKVSKKDLDDLSNAQIEFEEVYKQVSVEPEVKPANDVVKIIDEMIDEKLTLVGVDDNGKEYTFGKEGEIIKYGYDLALKELKNRLSV